MPRPEAERFAIGTRRSGCREGTRSGAPRRVRYRPSGGRARRQNAFRVPRRCLPSEMIVTSFQPRFPAVGKTGVTLDISIKYVSDSRISHAYSSVIDFV